MKLRFTIYRNLFFLVTLWIGQVYGQTSQTFKANSFIVNMGIVPQTVSNGLKPYGLVYDLVKNYNVPVSWVINPNKTKDGVDFSFQGTQFRGGSFIIPAEFRTPEVNARIAYWQGQGVEGIHTTSPLTLDIVYNTITSVPRWTLDLKNGSIALSYLNNAMIPSTAYNYKEPQKLDCCDDIFAMPHADPTWATHSNLYFWNQSCKGGIWAACHAVSAMENSINPINSSQQMNFLSNRNASKTTPTPWPSNSLTLWGDHVGGSPAYVNRLAADPVQQYIGSIDAATQNGSEQIYLPIQAGSPAWNAGAKILVYDPTQANVADPKPDLSKVAVAAIYGRGFDDTNRGYVMYEAGHSHAKATAPENIAAQRAFINFSFLNQFERAPIFNAFSTPPTIMNAVQGPYNFSVNAASALGGSLHYEWKSSCGGTFSTPNASTTTFSPPVVSSPQQCIISVIITDQCGRSNSHSWGVTINQGPQPPIARNDTIRIPTGCGGIDPVTINIGTNDIDPDGDPLTFSLLGTGTGGTWIHIGGGVLHFTPSGNFSGTAIQQYRVCDNTVNPSNLCATAYAVAIVGTTDVNGCLSNQTYGFTGNYQNATTQSTTAGTITNGANILGEADELFAQIGNNNAATIQVDMGVLAPAGRTFRMIWKSVNTNVSTVTIAYSSNGTSFTNLSGSISTVTDHSEFQESEFVLPAAARYLRIARSAGTPQIDAIGFEEYGCVSRAPKAVNNTINMLEDLPVQVNVLANDLDPAGEVLSLRRIVSSPKRGTVSVNLNGTITYVNNTDISGRDTLTYEVCNTSGYCSTAYVYFNSVDDACSAGQYKPYTVGGAITKTFQYGFTGTNAASANNDILKFKDTYINQGSTNTNYGGVNKVEAGKVPNSEERLLNYFDISEIPTNAIVQSATFSLYGKGGDNNAMIFTIENLNATFTENQVNWNNRATATPWTAPGAGSNVGAVWSSTTIGTIKNVRHTWDVSNLVQSWVATPANNHGILIRQNGSVNKKKQFATKEGSLAERPILTVTYVVPAPCTAIPNRAPLAQPDFATIKSTDTVWVKPLTNDKDPDVANTLSLNSIVAVTNGTAIAQGDSLRFIPTLGFNGIATVRYVISDNFGLRDTALIRITCTNAAPIAQNDIVSNLSGTTFNILVKSNDLDPEGDTLSVPSVIVRPKHGEAKVVGTAIQYIPNDGYTGKDTIRYSICETIFDVNNCQPVFLCDSAYIFITVANRPPVANDDTKVTYLCFESVFGILENDSNPEQTDITISIINGPHRGTVRIGEDDKLYYRANNGFIGNDTIVYVITDSDNPPLSDTAKVYINIQIPVNEPPVAMDDYEESGLYETLYASVLDNDEDPDGDPLMVSLRPELLQPSKGTAEVLPNGLIKYIPFPGAFGQDSLDYQICEGAITDTATCLQDIGFCDIARLYIDIKVFNTTFAVDDENSTWINTPVGGNIPSNDFDKEGDMQTFGSFLNPTKTGNITSGSIVPGIDANGNPVTNAGTLTFNPDGSYIYTPALDFIGDISVPYFLCDNGTPTVCDTAYLDITVSPLPNISNSIIANNDEYFTYGSPINSDVFVNDADPQGDHFTLTSYRYDSDGDGIPDATGTIGAPITVAGVREDGAAVANAGTLTQRADGTFTFVSTPGFVGQVTYNYTITDDGTPVATDHANVVITVVRDENGPLNDPPFAGDDFSYTPINTPVKGNFINNDNDPNNNPISYNGITIDPNGPAASIDTLTTEKGGLVVIHQDGTYTYYPPTDYIGPDRVEYEICDVTVIEPQPLCADATIHLLVGTGYKISGNVYNDGNGMTDNILNGTGTHSDGKIYAVLTDTNGLVLQSVPVKPDGTWEFENVPGGIELTILIDTVHRNKNEIVTVSTLPENWIHTGEKNGIGSGHDGNIDGISNIIPPLTADVDQINFGIERPPVADNKLYIVANSAFKEGAPNGYPDINDFDRYFTISTGSSQLLNNGRGGSLTGKDAEDCPSDQECHTGSTFKLEQVYPSTILYYDYGGETGIRRLQEGDVIPSYNPDNLIIYANEGSGTTDSPVGFNYSMIDGAGVSGSPATYVIFTENPLPVELLIFTANVLECQIKLSWATASELNNKYFEIQRSYDAKSWVVIGEISGNGTSNMRHDYQFLDAIHEQNNTIYYRLKQVDYDGTVEFHKMISIQTVPCHPVDIGVYPNPVQKVLNVKTNGINENIYIELTDLTGRTILRKMAESHVTQLDVSNLLSGTYLISIKDKINKVLKSTKIEIIR